MSYKITVCSECLRASCLRGDFYCENYKNASVIKVPIDKLRQLGLESPSYWDDQP